MDREIGAVNYEYLQLLAISAHIKHYGSCRLQEFFDGRSFASRLVPSDHKIDLSPGKRKEMERLASVFDETYGLDPRKIVISIAGGEPQIASAA